MSEPTKAGAVALESRLYAPCCYNGTLDTHDSELARDLRHEIEGRLAKGETSEAIQSDFVARYGERVIAASSDAPIRGMGFAVVLLMIAAAVALGAALRRWAKKTPATVVTHERDELDDRVDAELAEIE